MLKLLTVVFLLQKFLVGAIKIIMNNQTESDGYRGNEHSSLVQSESQFTNDVFSPPTDHRFVPPYDFPSISHTAKTTNTFSTADAEKSISSPSESASLSPSIHLPVISTTSNVEYLAGFLKEQMYNSYNEWIGANILEVGVCTSYTSSHFPNVKSIIISLLSLNSCNQNFKDCKTYTVVYDLHKSRDCRGDILFSLPDINAYGLSTDGEVTIDRFYVRNYKHALKFPFASNGHVIR